MASESPGIPSEKSTVTISFRYDSSKPLPKKSKTDEDNQGYTSPNNERSKDERNIKVKERSRESSRRSRSPSRPEKNLDSNVTRSCKYIHQSRYDSRDKSTIKRKERTPDSIRYIGKTSRSRPHSRYIVYRRLRSIKRKLRVYSSHTTDATISISKSRTPLRKGSSRKQRYKERKQDILRSMQKARKDNCSIKIRYGKVLFCGAGAAGKTNFLNLLMDKDFEMKHMSTEIVKPQQVTIAMKAQVSSNDDEIGFKKMDIDDEIHQLMSYLPKKYTEQDAIPHHMHPQPTVQEDVSQNSYTAAEDKISDKLASGQAEFAKEASEDEWNILTFMDTGGQPQFVSMLPTVNSFAMITFIVHKMTGGSKSLDEKVMVQHGNEHGKSSFTPHPHKCTYIQLIKTLMTYASSILLPDVKFLQELKFKEDCKNTTNINSDISTIGTHSADVSENNIKEIDNMTKSFEELKFKEDCKNTTNINSVISIIGTHSADVSENDIKEIDATLTNMIDHADCKNVTFNLNKEYNFLVPVDNKKQMETNDSDTVINIKKYTHPSILRKHIHDCQMKQDVYFVPIKWILLELEIRKICNDKECYFITYSDVLKIAAEKNLGDEDFIKNGLKFHHLIGVLLYFENVEGMCELVITNHQWLFNKLTEIVLYLFKPTIKGERDELHKGIFKDAMLEKLNIEEDFKNANINTKLINPKKSFLNLLKHLRIIAPLNEDDTQYFMPSLLNSHPLTTRPQNYIPGKNIFIYQSNENTTAEPFLFQFESISVNLIPRGFFCVLVIELIHSTEWQLYRKNLHDNLVTFIKRGGYFVTLIDSIFFLQIHITHESGNSYPVHFEVRKIIQNTMSKVVNICGTLKYGFLCKNKKCTDTEQQHLTYAEEGDVNDVNPSDYMYCSINQKPTSLKNSHQIWLQQHKDVQGIAPNENKIKFDCAAAAKELKKQLGTLTKLNYSAMVGSLYSKEVITDDNRKIIDAKVGQEKMMYLLVDIIIPSLKLNFCEKYKGFLEALEESDDSDLWSTAKRLGGSKLVPNQQ